MIPRPVLWGMPASLYTGKARAALRKRRVPFDERTPGHPDFRARIAPAVGRWIIPVLECPDGALVQDSASIVEHLDALGADGPPSLPPDPALAAIARLLELFGGEGLLRPAMHYRWNFDADNLAFLRADFGASLAPPGADAATRAAAFDTASSRMRRAATAIGVRPHAIPAIEAAFDALLGTLDAHLDTVPYLLGPAPTVADYGLYGAFGPHLGRDPHPSMRIKARAPRVWRWIERMGAPDDDTGEFAGRMPGWLDATAPSATLAALLGHAADEMAAELRAHVAFADAWLAARPDLAAGTNGLERPGDRAIGRAAFDWRGLRLETQVLPYRFWLLQRFQDAVDACDGTAAGAGLRATLARAGLDGLVAARARRRVERRGPLEVWGEPRADRPGGT